MKKVPPIRLGADHVRSEYLTQLAECLSAPDVDRVERLLALYKPHETELQVSRALTLFPPARGRHDPQRDLRAFRGRVNDAVAEAGLELAIQVTSNRRVSADQRFVWFEAAVDLAGLVTEYTMAGTSRLDASGPIVESRALVVDGAQLVAGKQLIRCYLSIAPEDRELADDLRCRVELQLKSSRLFGYELWDGDTDILPGQDVRTAVEQALERSLCALLFISAGYLGGIAGGNMGELLEPGGKPVIPIRLKQFSDRADLRGLEARQFFAPPQSPPTRSYAECRGNAEKDAFALALFEAIERRMEEFATSLGAPAGVGVARVRPERLRRGFDRDDEALNDRAAALLHSEEIFIPGRLVPTSLDANELADVAEQMNTRQSEDALDFLRRWALDPNSPPFCAVLGEYGIGKTTTLNRLAQTLIDLRRGKTAGGEDAAELLPDFVPPPILIDLRRPTPSIRQGTVPKLEAFLQEILNATWESGERTTLTAKQVIRLAREEGALVIFDGLDEKLVHLDAAQSLQFVRELWSLLPPRTGARPEVHLLGPGGKRRRLVKPAAPAMAGRPGRMIISCRSHYFKTLRDQSSFFVGQRREGVTADHYRACILLPFKEEQIRRYFAHVPGMTPERVDSTMALLASVHNLTELSQRPYLLSLISGQVGRLERKQAAGQRLLAVDIYAGLVEDWLKRDEGKHRIPPEDKMRLMEDLAAEMWQAGDRTWTWAQVDDWLSGRWATDERLRHKCSGNTPTGARLYELVAEDFRTATFVLRPDTSPDEFRFAHTSLHEYFLARRLVRALHEAESSIWQVFTPSDETLDFVGQLLTQDRNQDAALRRLTSLLREGAPAERATAFRCAVRASTGNLPGPAPGHWNLSGLDLRRQTLAGDEERPLNLAAANLTGTRLTDSTLRNVDLSSARFEATEAVGTKFLNCRFDGASFQRATFVGAFFRDCSLRDGRDEEGANWFRGAMVRCRLTDVLLQAILAAGGSVAECGTESGDPTTAPQPGTARPQLYLHNGHSMAVLSAAWSHDGRRIVSASSDNTLRIWSADTGDTLRVLKGHRDWAKSVAWSQDGCCIVSASADHTLRIWDADTGDTLRVLQGHRGSVNSSAWLHNGRRVVSASDDNTLRIWDADTGDTIRVLEGHESKVNSAAWSPDGRRIVSASDDNTLRIWDADTGDTLRMLEGHEEAANSAAWSPDGRRILSASEDNTLRVWDAYTGDTLRVLDENPGGVNFATWSHDARHIVSPQDDDTLHIWDADTGDILRVLAGHASYVMSAAWSQDGRRIVSASADSTLRIWDADSGDTIRVLNWNDRTVDSAAWSPDGQRIVFASEHDTLRICDTETGDTLRVLEGHQDWVMSAAWSHDGERVVSALFDDTLHIWDAGTGDTLRVLNGHRGTVHSASWSYDGRRIVSTSGDDTLLIWDAATGNTLRVLNGHQDTVSSASWSRDGRRIVSASNDNMLRIWDTDTGATLRVLEGHQNSVTSASWSHDEQRIVSTSWDSTLRIWDAESGNTLRVLKGHKNLVTFAAWSPDGRRIVSASWDNTLRIWDADSGDTIRVLEGHESTVTSAAWSPDGRRIASASYDNTLRTWDADTGQCLRILYAGGPVDQFALIDPIANRVLNAGPEAWRVLRWQWFDPETRETRLLPAEHFGALPGGKPVPRRGPHK